MGNLVCRASRVLVFRASLPTLTQSYSTVSIVEEEPIFPNDLYHQQGRPSAGSVGRPGVATGLLFAVDEARVAHAESRFPTPGYLLLPSSQVRRHVYECPALRHRNRPGR